MRSPSTGYDVVVAGGGSAGVAAAVSAARLGAKVALVEQARSAPSFSKAEADGRKQAWAYLEVLRTLPGCEKAYLMSTGPEFGRRESRHINSAGQLVWADVEAGRPTVDSVALGAWGVDSMPPK